MLPAQPGSAVPDAPAWRYVDMCQQPKIRSWATSSLAAPKVRR